MKKTFKYCGTHRDDEAYMQKMCARGWAARSLTEGFWTFEPCKPGQYCYRICYLRGKSREEVDKIKSRYREQGIEFVSRYSFWAIFRREKPFVFYTPEEEREICRRIYAPMPLGAAISWLLSAGSVFLSVRLSPWFWLLTGLLFLYAAMCTWLGRSYRKLLRKL